MDRHQDIQPIAINLASHDIDIAGGNLQLLGPCFLIAFDTNPYPKILEEILLVVRLDGLITFHVYQDRYFKETTASCNKYRFLGINLHLMSTAKLSDPGMHTCDTLRTLGENHKVICIAS